LSKITHSVDKMPLYSSSFHHSFHTSINWKKNIFIIY
jgi:hypothetical protein